MGIINSFSLYIIIFLLIIVFTMVVIFIIKNNKMKELKKRDFIIDKILNSIKISNNLDDSLMELLSVLTQIVKAPTYAFYVNDYKNSSYILKAARSMLDGNITINPSYSGLLPYKKEKFSMPAVLSSDKIPEEINFLKQGEVPLILVPFKNEKGLILIGPISKISSRELRDLQQLSLRINRILDFLLEKEENKNKIKQIVSSENAVKNISNVFSDIKEMMEILLNIAVKSINANGGLFLSEDKGTFQVEKIIGLETEKQELLIRDTQTQSLLFDLIIDKDMIFLTKKDKDFFKIPPYFVTDGIEELLFVKVNSEKGIGLSVFWYKDSLSSKDHQIAAIKILSKRMGDLINNHINYQRIAYSYKDILKTLAKLIDNLSKNTVSYSELMYRYAFVIAKEMNLSKEEIEDISLAAYLSNIGVIGLIDQLLNKKGKYNEIEYENMKLHAQAGAAIIEATLGNVQVAAYIRHHHERYDGYGYPSRLKGEEIPLGARIIFVIQTFLAKIMSRDYRSAISFEEALNQLKIASGTQLDEKVVEAFISWFEKKEKIFKNKNCALGNCWDMRCSPEHICINCPAYKNTTKNCWEFGGANCIKHGNKCEDCFVRTEYLYRMKS
ncbi:HD domain-containing protein [Clostridium algoriphilum]|uniref:HD-GYP domain-containing protein n=1 Tax=Clostridium algoriphilum TaxID=198347 RepID=UPI001CF3D9A7|nr:HD domain-containing phosphohydrolase [Clostridium algoriphilum]MCB2292360.1 HD domain-containing protein [Clostridium algoriphilum]